MDPNANLREQERILSRVPAEWPRKPLPRADRERLAELREALAHWLWADGFAPDWSACPLAAMYYGRTGQKRS